MNLFRSSILHFLADPSSVEESDSYQYFPDGVLAVRDGYVVEVGPAPTLLAKYPEARVTEYHNALIVPGFVDTHIHYPQVDIIAAYGSQLLEWLENYTFPSEEQFADSAKADEMAEFFLDQLLMNGTTTALVFGTIHSESVDAFFSACEKRHLRMICGKVLMDRNVPEALCESAEEGYKASKALIEKWHGRARLSYAITPRYAPTCSDEQLSRAGALLKEYPGVFVHTHLSENTDEVAWVKDLFPERRNYTDVYHHHGLMGPRSVFAHGIHLQDEEFECFQKTDSGIAFCPTSNLFLGSGLFNLDKAECHQVKVGLGTDVGAGTSFSLLQTMAEAYKIQQLRKRSLSPFKSLYLATLGGARTLDLEDKIGNFEKGKEADFVVLDCAATALIERRLSRCSSLTEKLFALTMLGDDRVIAQTYIMGTPTLKRDKQRTEKSID